MTIRERVESELAILSDDELGFLESVISFLQSKRNSIMKNLDEAKLKLLYAETTEEDRRMAQEGMGDYSSDLKKEDKP